MNALEAAILGLVEGITEYLPVSSTGHLILTSALLYGPQHGQQKEALDAFEIVIQGGAILAVAGLYWPRVLQMIRGLMGKDAAGLRLLINLFIAFLPAAIIGWKLHDRIKAKLFHPAPVLAALAIGGIVMIFIGRWQRRAFHQADDGVAGSGASPSANHVFIDIDQLTWKQALIIGMFQCFSLWPGTSRSMATIVGGMLVGMKPRQSAEFSFLLALPTLGAACAYKALKDHHTIASLGGIPIVVGILVAMISAFLAVKFLVEFLNRHGLAIFGWYRLTLCAVIVLLIWKQWVHIEP
jgi:undecaprenyl-diphosphatase